MRNFKKGLPLLLILPLVIAGIILSACFCPPAEAARDLNPVIQKVHTCCCPDDSSHCDPDVFESPSTASNSETAVSNHLSFPQKRVANLQFLRGTSFPLTEDIAGVFLRPPVSQATIPQDIFLKNEVLRI